MREFLHSILELIGLFEPDIREPGAIVRELRVRQRGLERGIVQAVEFEFEEEQLRGGVGQLLRDVAIELGALRIGCVAHVMQRGEGCQAPEQLLQAFVSPHHDGELGATARRCDEACQSALVRGSEGFGLGLGTPQSPPRGGASLEPGRVR